jgi:hypothetical protein
MSESDNEDDVEIPTREDVECRLRRLISGELSRAEAANWASRWLRLDNPPIDDVGVWDAIGALAGADMISIDRPWLFDERDYEAWLAKLLATPRPKPKVG